LGVSRETVRRDLLALAATGAVNRISGGAAHPGAPPRSTGGDPWRSAKAGVAEAAARLVRPGQTVALSAGTTTFALARALARIPGLTIVTNSLPASRALRTARPDQRLVVTGGVPGIVGALLGPMALHTVRALNVDWLFLGTNGLDVRAGITADDLGEAQLHREWVHHAGSVAVVTDHTKWGVTALSTVLPLGDVSVLVTDDGLPREVERAVRAHVPRLVLGDRTSRAQ
jgi:DeoR/GlpR family transcriptional regulator of sugar metabolism